MLLSHYTDLAIAWCKSLCKVQCYLKPSSPSKTYTPVKSSKPLPTADRVPKCSLPFLIPYYAPSLHGLDLQVDSIQSYLHILKNSIDANINSIMSDDVPIILNSGCSITVTNNPNDFLPNSLRKRQFTEVKGISSGLKIDRIGVVNWKLRVVDGHIGGVQVQAIYVLACPFPLLSPQQLS
jgi:hypothetical protein